jgi:hypothetical protein
LRQRLGERREAAMAFRIVGGPIRQHADAPHPLVLLRARRELPCRYRAAEKANELTSPHILTQA